MCLHCAKSRGSRWQLSRGLDSIQDGSLVVEYLPRRTGNNPLDLGCWQTPTAGRLVRRALNESMRDIVPIAPGALHRVARSKTFAAFVEQLFDEWAWCGLCHALRSAHRASGQECLDPLPCVHLDDRLVLAWKAETLCRICPI
jgi:hypothetical protein